MLRNLKRGGCNFLFPFPLKISVKTKKKAFTSIDVQFTPQNHVKTKKRSSSPQMSCFHRSANCTSAYISARPLLPHPLGFAPDKLDLIAFIVRSGSDLKTLGNVFAAKIALLMWVKKVVIKYSPISTKLLHHCLN